MSVTDTNYKKAFIKFVNVELPEIKKLVHNHTVAMNNLARKINLMPRSVQLHP